MSDRPRYYGIMPVQQDDAVVGHEKLALVLDELRPLHELHYDEVERHILNAPFEPGDYSGHVRQEEMGQFVLITLRVAGELVGYLQFYVFRNPYAQSVRMAKEDALFIRADHRGKGYLKLIAAFAEQLGRELKCDIMGMSHRAVSGSTDVTSSYEQAGYRPVATYFVKHLKAD